MENIDLINKKKLRKKFLKLRNTLPNATIEAMSWDICDRLFCAFDWTKYGIIHIFLPIMPKKEINTMPFILRMWQNYPSLKICVPVVNGITNVIESFIFEKGTKLKTGNFGVPEPQNTLLVAPQKIDLVIMPLVISDYAGNRIGYGKGHYDRFLAECSNNIVKIGLSIFPPLLFVIDCEAHDTPLNYLVSPTNIYTSEIGFEIRSFKNP